MADAFAGGHGLLTGRLGAPAGPGVGERSEFGLTVLLDGVEARR
ncbi:hypothetical protein ACQ4WX_47155 [Streptomyces lasalocidi]|nr:hypothetical protein [Streptomyces sp. MUSC 14]